MMRRALCVGMAIALLAGTLSVCFSVGPVNADSPSGTVLGMPNAPIRIDSNADFPGIATAGNGSAGNPWVIENWEIDGAQSGNCIYVGNTTDYFIIQDCLLSNSSGLVPQPYWSDAGIVIYNSNNGHILNNTIVNITGKSGIDGEEAAGICLRFSDNNIIESNTIFNITGGNHAPAGLPGTGWGILLDALSDNNIISNNEISNIGVGSVVYFKDDVENGAMKWTHSSTLVIINGEGPLEYYFDTELDTDVVSDWNSTLSVGIAGTNVTYHSYNESFYFEEPVAGNSNKTAVTDIFNLTNHDSAILSFWHMYNLTADENGVFLQVGYKDITQGAVDDWDWKYVDPAYYTGSLNTSEFVNDTWGNPITDCWNNISGGGAYDWEYVEIDIMDFVPGAYADEVRVKFNYTQFGGGSGDGWYVDDVRITASRLENSTIDSEFKDVWQITNTTSHSGDNCWSNIDPATGFLRGGIDNYLTTVPVDLTSVINANLTAYLRFNINEDNGAPPDGFRVVTSNNVSYQHNNNNNCPDPGFGGLYLDDVEVRGTPLFELLDGRGIGITNSDDNQIYENNVSNCHYGAYSFGSVSNILYHNNFVNNLIQAWDTGTNSWDNGYPSGGNYWSDYSGIDDFHGFGQNIAGSDGLGDTNYTITGGVCADNYPLMGPYIGHTFGETVPPIALNHAPVGNDIAVDSVISIEWNETMNWTSVEEAFNYTDGTTVFNSSHGVWMHNSISNVSTFNPTASFDYEVQYNITVNCSAADVIGNQLDQNNNSIGGEWPDDVLTWNFTTTDSAPWIMSTIPANNQIEVAPDTIIKIIFSEEMNTTTVESAFTYSNATEAWGVSDGVVYWEAGDSEFTFVPLAHLENNMTYSAHINGAVAKDVGGKAIGANYSWTFTTWSEPPLPHVIDVDPADGSTGIPINFHINVEFDMAMDQSSTENAFSYTDGSEVWDGSDGVFVWSANNASFSFRPNAGLYHNTTFTVTVDGTASSTYGKTLDGDGDGVIGVDDSYSFSFTTALLPPRVLWTDPGEAETDVRVDTPAILIHFNRRMDTATVNAALTITPHVNHTNIWRGDNYNITIILDEDLEEGEYYQVKILATATDIFGTKLDGNNDGVAGDNFVLTFITEGANISEAPYVVSVFPPPGNVTVPINTFIGISFSTAMNRTSVENAFSFTNASGPVNGTFSWTSDKTLKFNPAQNLAYNTTYFVDLGIQAFDRSGFTLEEGFSWQFTTESEGGPDLLHDNWWLIAIIVVLLFIICAQYLKDRGTQLQLRRARVQIHKLKKGDGSHGEAEDAPPAEDTGGEVEAEGPASAEENPEHFDSDQDLENNEGVPRQ